MRKITLLVFILAALVLLPLVAGAQRFGEFVAITAVAATSNQTSAVIVKPQGARGMLIWMNVTAGSSLLLDVDIYAYSPTIDTTVGWFMNMPTAEGITGTGSVGRAVLGGYGTANDYTVNTEDAGGLLPNLIVLVVDHGNATAATYVLYYQWLW